MHRSDQYAAYILLLLTFSLPSGSLVRAQSGSLLLADFDGDKLETRSELAVWIYADEQLGGTSESRTSRILPGANGTRAALRISFRVTEEFANPFAGAWAMVAPEGRPTDLSAYRGVRFYARSKDPKAFTAGIINVPGGLRRYMTPFTVQSEWTVIELPFDAFREVAPTGRPGSGEPLKEAKDVTSIGFSVAAPLRGQFELHIDGIEVYK